MSKRRGFLRSLFAAPVVVPAIAAAVVKAEAEPERVVLGLPPYVLPEPPVTTEYGVILFNPSVEQREFFKKKDWGGMRNTFEPGDSLRFPPPIFSGEDWD